jgi:hypothetical protein
MIDAIKAANNMGSRFQLEEASSTATTDAMKSNSVCSPIVMILDIAEQ